ncbi:murein L,D-transpeptidase [Candidatus Liberibacter asiaticus]|uniref:L,D-transpeptidase family protein n=1 Tax=Liberibacter asiaticus TaxID=34021 RepID=UPI0012F50745|nr:L,D-transpeptidase family protein [Candidatus Liberibacter asiaticus]KAE9517874.1 murein L,D-transpeptidase [Candidatus Liberibacter asiaticus]
MVGYLKINKRLYCFFVYLILPMGLSLVEQPIHASVLDEIINESYHSIVNDRFDNFLARVDMGIDSDIPIISKETIAQTEKAIAFYQDILSRGGWPELPIRPLHLGNSSVSVQRLRERLIISGDLDPSKGLSVAFDAYVESAVKLFQMRHGLDPSGMVDSSTLEAMNVPVDLRIRQLQVNLMRIKKLLEQKMGLRYVLVNIPAASLEAVENGKVGLRSTVIVGRVDRQTPILHSRINRIMFNPYWVIPRSIIQKDMMALLRQDPQYLKDNNIHMIDEKGKEVFVEEVDWNSPEPPNFIFRQDPGKINAMASTKIEFYSRNNTYMHDTPEPILFNNVVRFETSGCVRVRNIIDLDVWLLKDTPTWSRYHIEEVVKTRKTTPVKLATEVPVHFVYISAWSPKDSIIQFRDDIYGLDNVHVGIIPLPEDHPIDSD